MATVNLGQAAIVSKGAYSAAASYAPLNLVTHNGGSYLCKTVCSNIEPGVASSWQTYWVAATVGIKSVSQSGETAAGIEYTIALSDGSNYTFTVKTAVDYPISIENGGTGATTAAAALAALGALPVSGGTVNGKIISERNGYNFVASGQTGDVGLQAVNAAGGNNVMLGAYDNGTVGIYMGHLSKWLIKNDGTKTTVDNTIPATDGAVQTANLGDGVVTRAKLAQDAIGTKVNNVSTGNPFTPSNNGALCYSYSSSSAEWTVNSDVLAALPVGWTMTFLSASNSQFTFKFVGIELMDFVGGTWTNVTQKSYATYTFGDGFKFVKRSNNSLMIIGAGTVHSIRKGPSAPAASLGNVGDLFAQYNA